MDECKHLGNGAHERRGGRAGRTGGSGANAPAFLRFETPSGPGMGMTPRAIRRGRLRPSAGARGCDRGRNDAERLQPRTPACSTNFENNAEIRARFQSGGDSSDRLRARRIWYAKFHSGVGTTPEALVLARARRRDARLGASAVLRRRVHVRIGRGVEPHVEAHTLPVRVDARSAFDPRVDPARGRARDSDPNSHRPRVPPGPDPSPPGVNPSPITTPTTPSSSVSC